jgi:hypothetical protein
MEKALLKLVRQIMAFDEASLTSMWEKNAQVVEHFEPTARWEEAAVMLGMIQAVRWKNQLFNHHWKEMRSPEPPALHPAEALRRPPAPGAAPAPGSAPAPALAPGSGPVAVPDLDRSGRPEGKEKRGKVLTFRPREGDDGV